MFYSFAADLLFMLEASLRVRDSLAMGLLALVYMAIVPEDNEVIFNTVNVCTLASS